MLSSYTPCPPLRPARWVLAAQRGAKLFLQEECSMTTVHDLGKAAFEAYSAQAGGKVKAHMDQLAVDNAASAAPTEEVQGDSDSL